MDDLNKVHKIYIVDDELDILHLLQFNLKKSGYKVFTFLNAKELFELMEVSPPDLFILDIMLPDVNGLDICSIIRDKSALQKIPILMLSAKSEDNDVIRGLDIGADDYITKPFSIKILKARISALLRRHQRVLSDSEDLIFNNLTILPEQRIVKVEGKTIELTNYEFKILHLMATHQSLAFSRSNIIDIVHGDDHIVTERTVDFQIVGLRKKLGVAGAYIKTVRSVGYRFEVDE